MPESWLSGEVASKAHLIGVARVMVTWGSVAISGLVVEDHDLSSGADLRFS